MAFNNLKLIPTFSSPDTESGGTIESDIAITASDQHFTGTLKATVVNNDNNNNSISCHQYSADKSRIVGELNIVPGSGLIEISVYENGVLRKLEKAH